MADVLLGLGGNLGDPLAAIEAALRALDAHGVRVTARSRAYRTAPWGVTNQPDFVNLCAAAATALSPRALLAAALGVEAALGRTRRERWGPRAIDVDLLAYDDLVLDEPGLTLPHPRLTQRAFVLVPLAEIAPDRVVAGRRVAEWAAGSTARASPRWRPERVRGRTEPRGEAAMTDVTAHDLTTGAAFPPATHERWRALVDGVLKGGDFERRLVARSRDGLAVGPLYEAAPATAQPLRGASGPWRIAARVDHPEPAEAASLALADLEGGAGALDLVFAGAPAAHGHGLAAARLDDLDRALAGVVMPIVGLRLDAGGAGRGAAALLVALAERRGHALGTLDLDLGLDPVGAFAATGRLSAPWEIVAARSAETLAALDARGFQGLAFRADGRPFHEAGASEAQELAAVLAVGLAHLRALEAGGHPLARARAAIGFRMAADAEIFLTVAKFRALRRLWARVEAACGLDPRPLRLDAETAWRTTTRRDPWVNLLRGTVAAFAAGLGGADAVTVLPFTAALGLPDAFARRLARNAQLVLLEEANLARVADPAAGAGGFEALTEALCAAAWTAFQAIEAEGGIVASLAAGALQGRIAAVAQARARDVATRREPITGTSEFPLLREVPVAVLAPATTGPSTEPPPPAPAAPAGVVAFADLVAGALAGEASPPPPPGTALAAVPLRGARLAEPFERLREAADRRPGGPPRVFLAALGPVAAHNARSTFARNAFEAGGIEAVDGEGAEERESTPEALAAAFRASGAAAACLCSSDALYAEAGPAAARALREAGAGRLWLAGRPGDDEAAWREAGVTGFLYAGCDLLALLEEAAG